MSDDEDTKTFLNTSAQPSNLKPNTNLLLFPEQQFKKHKINSTEKPTISESNRVKFIGQVHATSVLPTFGATLLSTNVLHHEGIQACKETLETRTIKEPETWVILRSSQFILAKPCFTLNDQFYEPISGTTMEKCASRYSTIFRDQPEQKHLARKHIQPPVWWRYIDNIFLIWPHSREELNSFISGLNRVHFTIKLTSDISDTSINFLNLKITKNANGTSTTRHHTRKTDDNSTRSNMGNCQSLWNSQFEPPHGKTNNLHRRKQRHRSASR